MLIKSTKGYFELTKNYKKAFDLAKFEDKYIEECFDAYLYLVGDLSGEILRLKGFNDDKKKKNYYGLINDYIDQSCTFDCPYYILRRIKDEKTFLKMMETYKEPNDFEEEHLHTSIEKIHFDKESLILESTPKQKPNIILNMNKINSIPKGHLICDLSDECPEEKVDFTETYVSKSPGFDETKINNTFKNNKKNNQKQSQTINDKTKQQSKNKNDKSNKQQNTQNCLKGLNSVQTNKQTNNVVSNKKNGKKKKKNRGSYAG